MNGAALLGSDYSFLTYPGLTPWAIFCRPSGPSSPAGLGFDQRQDASYGRIEVMPYERITVRAGQMGGQPRIRNLRIPVATVVAMLADGMTHDDILAAYPDLERADIDEALRYAAEAVRERELPLRSVV